MALTRYHLRRAFFGFSKSFYNNSPCVTSDFFNNHGTLPISITVQKRHAGYRASEPIHKYEGIVKNFEVTQDPQEWKFVERLLPMTTVPKPPQDGIYTSDWKPQVPELYQKLPYFVKRTKSHMVPVYLHITARGEKRTTRIRYVFGDIWTLSEDVNEYLKMKHKRVFAVRVNEFIGCVIIRGDFVLDVKEYLLSVGL